MLKVVSVLPAVSRIGIHFADLESVKGALMVFSQGSSRSSGSTRQNLMSQVSGEGAATMLMHDLLLGNRDRFLDHLFEEMDTRFQTGFSFEKSYDYDGQGPFFKTNVGVEKVKSDGTFVLTLYAAYVGRAPEDGLAEALEVQQSLNGSHVHVAYDHTVKGDFVIDFDPIAEALSPFTNSELTGSMIAGVIAAGDKDGGYGNLIYNGGVYTLFDETDTLPGVFVSMDSSSVESYREHPFTADGSVLRGGMKADYDDKSKMLAPTVRLTVSGKHAEAAVSWQHLPILDPQVEADVLKLNGSITERLQLLL